MRKTLLLLLGGTLLLAVGCNQEPKMPSEEEIAQKVQDKYGAELNTLKELKKLQCDESIDAKVSERLLDTTSAI